MRGSRGPALAVCAAMLLTAAFAPSAWAVKPSAAPSAPKTLSSVQSIAKPGVVTAYASPVYEKAVWLDLGDDVIFETQLTSGDSVMHLLAPGGAQVAMDDDGGPGLGSRIEYSSLKRGWHTLVVRAYSDTSAGQADVSLNGTPIATNVQFAGVSLSFTSLRASERIETVLVPNGSPATHRLYVMAPNGADISARRVGGGTAGAAQFAVLSDWGTRRVIVGAPLGWLRVVRNDAVLEFHDLDGDGLGHELEAAIGTCSMLTGSAAGFDCSRATDARDTDGDGISDGWEVLGRRDATPHQPLPLWGADPRHKDLFVEVDFALRGPSETPLRMTAAVARGFASYYQDQIGTFTEARYAAHAASLRNPDGKPGIAVHLDTGRAPVTSADATTYGDWGGYTAVPAVQRPDGSWTGQDSGVAWKQYMAPVRRGIFRYSLPYSSGGGSTLLWGFTWAAGINDAWILAHESSHAMGLDHGGVLGGQPGGDAVGVNCKPNYPSLANYAFDSGAFGFSDGVSGPPLSNAALKEWGAATGSPSSYIDALEKVFGYYVDRTTGSVDWNRDGTIAPSGTTVRAYANYRSGGGGCEFTRYNQAQAGNAASYKSPALARLGSRLYMFISVLGSVMYNDSTSTFACSITAPTCGSWSNARFSYGDAGGGIDAVRADGRIMVVAAKGDGTVTYAFLSVDAQGNESWTDFVRIGRSVLSGGEPALVAMSSCDVRLAYRGRSDNVIRTQRWTCSGGWQSAQLARRPDGSLIKTAPYSSPGMVRAYLSWRQGAALYGAFPDENGRLDLYGFDPTTQRWSNTNLLDSRPGPLGARPAMAWVPSTTTSDTPGRLYVMTVDHDAGAVIDKGMARMLMSYMKVTGSPPSTTKTQRVGLAGPVDNVWYTVYGLDLLFERGVDTNLRQATSHAYADTDFKVYFRPRADGIQSLTYRDSNDWATLRLGVCRGVVNPGGTVANPIKCP